MLSAWLLPVYSACFPYIIQAHQLRVGPAQSRLGPLPSINQENAATDLLTEQFYGGIFSIEVPSSHTAFAVSGW